MTKFTYNDIVTAVEGSELELRPGEKGWICGVYEKAERAKRFIDKYGSGAVYLMEFEDGEAVQAHESQLKLIDKYTENNI